MTTTVAHPSRRPVTVPRTTAARLLMLALLLSSLYAGAIVLEVAKPDSGGLTPGLFYPGAPTETYIPFWGAVASWAAALGLGAVTAVRCASVADPATRRQRLERGQVVIAGVLVVPFVIDPVIDLVRFFPLVLACLPPTLVALWGVHRLQRFRRLPVPVLLAAFAGGPLLGCGFGGSMNSLYVDYSQAYLVWPKVAGMTAHPDLARLRDGTFLHEVLAAKQLTNSGLALDAGIFEELGKGVVLAAVFLLCRRWWDGVLSGAVLGMAVGLGFNLLESVEYMTGDAFYQFWIRQGVGLMAAHTAFSAIVGAGFGIASRLAAPNARRLAIGAGLITAICGHFATDSLLFAFSGRLPEWLDVSSAVDVLVLQPLELVLLQGPFVLMYLLLVKRALRDQAAALATGLAAESAAADIAVTAEEIPILLSPRRRTAMRGAAFRYRGGLRAYRYIGHLHDVQIDLGLQHTGFARDGSRSVATLRRRVAHLKQHPGLQRPRPAATAAAASFEVSP
ncbi:PrsW family intramembrane metalloprotease [Amycolatopsis nalaikhensis]|uniref:PrsW family glutamic-type intramembrane protease n=1 Tax=Amycolatopsis nalaikhensis TaxID=715472 RepID=A0ABY8XU64_9PSEU|nr:PrsW family glutamic-type intramembrane protease [Amycolatopsis sp. 2-2]WIV59229.1 PrsW family glutamic-type intramembrane protease [Amycolatopsis sp. 2-2]